MFNLQDDIPSYRIVEIYNADAEGTPTLVTNKPLIMNNELSIKVTSKYGELLQSTPSEFMTLLSGAFGIPNGQFTLQGVQIWQIFLPGSVIKWYYKNYNMVSLVICMLLVFGIFTGPLVYIQNVIYNLIIRITCIA